MSFMNSEKEALDLPAIVTGNGEAYPKQWLAVYVRLYHEKKTSARLNTMGIENFLPIQEEIHQWSDRRKKISRVLIPMIVFVHVDALERKKVLELYSVNRYMVIVAKVCHWSYPTNKWSGFGLCSIIRTVLFRLMILP